MKKNRIRRKIVKQLMYGLLTLLLLLNSAWIPGLGSLEKVQAGEGSNITPLRYTYQKGQTNRSMETLNGKEQTQYVLDNTADEKGLPSFYSSVDAGYITVAKDQENTEFCWNYGAASVAEACMIKNYGAPKSIDYADRFLANWKNKENTDEFSTMYGDYSVLGATVTKNRAYTTELIGLLMSWCGMVKEGQQGTTRYSSDAHLQEARYYSDDDIGGIKRAVLENGAVYLYLFTGTVKESEDRWGEWSQNHVSLTYPNGHVVAIVGWDDTFEDKGAWLCKNNYGPGYGNNGFYWIPYNSTGINHMVSLRFEPADNYDNNNQYDGSINGASYTGGAANIFCAKNKEEIAAVGIYMLNNPSVAKSLDYTIKIYRNLPDRTNPIAGELVETVTGTLPNTGYYTIPLEHKVQVAAGELYSVVLETNGFIGHDNHCLGEGTSFELVNGVYEDCIAWDYNCSIKSYTNNLPDEDSYVIDLEVKYERLEPTLYWNPVEDAVGYAVYYEENGTEHLLGETRQCAFRITDTHIFQDRFIRAFVKPIIGTGEEVCSNEVTVKVKPLQIYYAGKGASEDTLDIRWDYIEEATVYRLYQDGNLVKETTVPEATLTGLTPGQRYKFSVSALVDGLESDKSPEVEVLFPANRYPTNLQATVLGRGVTFTWDGVGEETARYRIRLNYTDYPEDEPRKYEVTINAGQEETYTIEKLEEYDSAENYIAWISYVEEGFKSREYVGKEAVRFSTYYCKIENECVTPGDGQFTVTWDKVKGADYCKVRVDKKSGWNWDTVYETDKILQTQDISQNSVVVTGLENGEVYNLEIQAYANGIVEDVVRLNNLTTWNEGNPFAMPTILNRIEYGQTLEKVQLSNPAWKWSANTAIKPGVNDEPYRLHYDNQTTGEYYAIFLKVPVNKITPVIKRTTSTQITGRAGSTLEDISVDYYEAYNSFGDYIDGDFYWKDPTIYPPIGESTQKAVFIPDDPYSCDSVEFDCTIYVNGPSADSLPPNAPAAQMTVPYPKSVVDNSMLPQSWQWDSAEMQTELVPGVPAKRTAVYIGTERAHYGQTSVEVTVLREECAHVAEKVTGLKAATCAESGYTGDAYCSICGLTTPGSVITVRHIWNDKYLKNETGHWQECSVCTKAGTVEGHTYSDTADSECDVCGFVREVGTASKPTPTPTKEPAGNPTAKPDSGVSPTKKPVSTEAPTVESPTTTSAPAPTEAPAVESPTTTSAPAATEAPTVESPTTTSAPAPTEAPTVESPTTTSAPAATETPTVAEPATTSSPAPTEAPAKSQESETIVTGEPEEDAQGDDLIDKAVPSVEDISDSVESSEEVKTTGSPEGNIGRAKLIGKWSWLWLLLLILLFICARKFYKEYKKRKQK